MSNWFYASYAVLWILICVMFGLIVLLYRHFGLAAMDTAAAHSRDGLPIGSKAPSIDGVDALNNRVRWEPSLGRVSVLYFGAPTCAPCQEMMPHIEELALKNAATLEVVVVVPGGAETAASMQRHGESFRCIADGGGIAASAYSIVVSPFGFLVDDFGAIRAKGLLSNVSHLDRLLSDSELSAEPGHVLSQVASLLPEPHANEVNGRRGQL